MTRTATQAALLVMCHEVFLLPIFLRLQYAAYQIRELRTYNNIGGKFGGFLANSQTAKFNVPPIFLHLQYDKSAIFTPRKTCMRMNQDHVASGHFGLGRDVLCKFNYWPLAVSMPPTKVCPECKDAVPVRRRHVHAVILSFDPNEKLARENSLANYETLWEQ